MDLDQKSHECSLFKVILFMTNFLLRLQLFFKLFLSTFLLSLHPIRHSKRVLTYRFYKVLFIVFRGRVFSLHTLCLQHSRLWSHATDVCGVSENFMQNLIVVVHLTLSSRCTKSARLILSIFWASELTSRILFIFTIILTPKAKPVFVG